MERQEVTRSRGREGLYTKTIAISAVALLLVTLLHYKDVFGQASRVGSKVSITFQEGNFTTTSIQNLQITNKGESSVSDREESPAVVKSEELSVESESPETAMEVEMDLSYQESDSVRSGKAPKVALMFLSLGELHNEPVWRAFFEIAGTMKFRYQPPDRPYKSYVDGDGKEFFDRVNGERRRSLLQSESIINLLACDKEPKFLSDEIHRLLHEPGDASEVILNQELFSVYTHPSHEFHFSKDSIFYGTEIPDRFDTAHSWGSFRLVGAEIKLLRNALKEERNQKFVLLSESCVPLHRPELIYLQLLSEEKSRINACGTWDQKNNPSRWDSEMETDYLSAANWRKSSQWFCLKRSHAEIIARETHVRQKFQRYCSAHRHNHCVPDEHYIPTALAVYGMDDETDCKGDMTAAWWPSNGRMHPVSFLSKNVNAILFKKLRHLGHCMVGTAQASTLNIFVGSHSEERCLLLNNTVVHHSHLEDRDDWVVQSGYVPLGYNCPLFARKFAKQTVRETLKTALSCSGSALGHWC